MSILLFIACAVLIALLLIILVDYAGLSPPIPLILKLVIVLVALYVIVRRLGYA